MRLKLILSGVMTLAPALVLTGCGMDQLSFTPTPNNATSGLTGRAFAGQQPVVGATIAVVQMGSTGYGSTGTILATAVTDSGGNFSFGSYACPASNPLVYLLGIGGNAGAGNNSSAVEAAALGTCTNAKQSFVVMNEVTTAATAFVFSHFFSTTLGGSAGANDWIGGPTLNSKGLMLASNVTIPVVVDNAVGAPPQNYPGYTVEATKINTIANILAACLNTSGSTSTTETKTPCGKLFNWTKNGMTVRPSDTLQAAVMMALYPNTQVTNLYNSITAQAPFLPYLTSQPNDWSIGISYTTSSLGLAVDAGTTSTLDIDSSGRIWFPSNASGQAGAAYFDPASRTFNGPFNTTSLGHPQQVAIDANGYAWYNDSTTSTVAGYLTTTPAMTEMVSLPGTLSTGLTVGGDDRINVGVSVGSTYETANVSADRTGYAILPGITFAFPVASLAGDINDDYGVSSSNPTTTQTRGYYVTTSSPASVTQFTGNVNANGAQIIYTGNDDILIRSYAGNAADGLCIMSLAACANFQGAPHEAAQGLAIDGGKQLWVAESGNGGVLQIPVNNPGATDGAVYLNSNGNNNVPNNEFLHGASNGGTATAPFGIGVDAVGNVWVTNAGCNVANCTPGTFTLTEIVGAGYPTITPVSAQITNGNLVGTLPTN